MNNISSFITPLCFLFATSCNTTNNFYQGKVQDETGTPLQNVLVIPDHDSTGTHTDGSGYFLLSKQEGWPADLVFIKDGFITDTIPSVVHHAGETTDYRFVRNDTTVITLKKITRKVATEHHESTVPTAAITSKIETVTVGTEITGEFDGDQHADYAHQKLVKRGEGNPVEDGIPDEYAVTFSSQQFPEIPAGCCDFRLVNEGDLSGDGADEISVYQAPMNGCSYMMYTYTFRNGKWKLFIAPFLIPTACEPFSDETIQQRLFMEKGTVYYFKTDVNDENFRLIKTKAEIR